MDYIIRGKSGSWWTVNAEKVITRFRDHLSVIVAPYDDESRLLLVEFLESEGFCRSTDWHKSRDEILSSFLPLLIDLREKSFHLIGNVTCAAAAASSKTIIGEKEFYILYTLFQKCLVPATD